MRRLLIIGCGDVARRALPWLARRFRVFAVVRSSDEDAAVRGLGAMPLRADLDRRDSLQRLAGLAHCVLYAAPPDEDGTRDLRMRRTLAALSGRPSLPQRISYISTTGVYGNCMGDVVTETRPLRPTTPRAQRRADAERQLRRFARRHLCSVAILRAPGIYAVGRLPVERIARGDPVLARDDDVYTNHIHADDLARLASLALFRARTGRVLNACDDSDMQMGEYFDLVADAFSLPRPPRVPRSEMARRVSAMALSFMSESRRLSNSRIKRDLRCELRYPTVASCLKGLRGD